MGSRYLTDLANVIRAAGLTVREYNGWQQRARGSGGYESGRPTHVMCHHTASGSSWDGQQDADYIAVGHADAPLSNLYLDRTGLVWVLAAGATNTNGKGHDYWGGGVPNDSMNTYAIGIEAGNNGTGEQWPQVQQDAYTRLCKALCTHYGISNNHVRAHFEWAPDRKIDPAGNSKYASGGASWNMDAFRADTAKAGGSTPEPEPEPEPESMIVSASSSLWLGNGRLDNFMLGKNNGHTYHNWFTPAKGWSGIEDLGGVLIEGVSATGEANANGDPVRIDLTGKGSDNPPGLWHKWYVDGKWIGWERICDWPG